jgi:hypothetical protein
MSALSRRARWKGGRAREIVNGFGAENGRVTCASGCTFEPEVSAQIGAEKQFISAFQLGI